MPRFRKKPIEVTAWLWDPTDPDYAGDVVGWLIAHGVEFRVLEAGKTLVIPTLEGEMQAPPGWWIIQGVAGEFYPCEPAIFESTYERVG